MSSNLFNNWRRLPTIWNCLHALHFNVGSTQSLSREICRPLSATSLSQPKPFYVTSPIFYVNAAPHIGHLYTLILTDVLKRWNALQGRNAILCTGTDEHGMKIQQAASKANMDVRVFCDQNSKSFTELANAINVDYNHFIRTSEPEHRFAVQHFWLMLKEKGWIYTSKHEGWYSVSDETFYPQSQVHLALDPKTGRKFMASMETGKEVDWTSETNYHFRLSALRDRLLEFYRENPRFVVPATRMTEVVRSVESGLPDLSISRPVERLSWGVPVPDDQTQTIYVWLDALINYLTKANYPFQIPGQEQAAGWPADVHVVGKDIVRFHCIYWPAFLIALNIPLPKQVLTHAHWTLAKKKMSKSLGNVVNPFFAIDRFGTDAMRYYMIYDGGIRDDTSYENAYIIDRYKNQLSGGLGNLTSRVTRGKNWDVREAVDSATSGAPPASGKHAEEHRQMLIHLPEKVASKFSELDPGAALREIWNTIAATNAYMQGAAPWKMPRDKNSDLNSVIYLCAESLRICGILLQPFMPATTKKLLDLIGVASSDRHFVHAVFGSDSKYGKSKLDLGRGVQGVLFPPLPVEG